MTNILGATLGIKRGAAVYEDEGLRAKGERNPMKRPLFFAFTGIIAIGLLFAGTAAPALAAPTSISIYSNNQTYVVSGTQNSEMYGTPEEDTNFYGKGL